MKNLGVCPVCEQGNMIEGTIGYACNYFKSLDDTCGFTIYKQYFGKEISEEMAVDLIEKKETKVYKDFVTHSKGTAFSSKLQIVEGHIKPIFEQSNLKAECPECSGKVSFSERAVFCENNGKENCHFVFSRNIAGYQLSEKDLEKIVEGAKSEELGLGSDFIEDFTSSKGDDFGAKIWIKMEGNEDGEPIWNTKFDFFLENCPKCEDGKVVRNMKAFGCSNWNKESIKCDFTVWRSIHGHDVSVNDVLGLIKNKETKIYNNLKKKGGGLFSGKFMLDEEFKVLVK